MRTRCTPPSLMSFLRVLPIIYNSFNLAFPPLGRPTEPNLNEFRCREILYFSVLTSDGSGNGKKTLEMAIIMERGMAMMGIGMAMMEMGMAIYARGDGNGAEATVKSNWAN